MQSKTPGRHNPFTRLTREAFNSMARSMMVCLPGHVVSFDEDNQLAQVQCGIQRVREGSGVDIPIIENVPVQFSGNDAWYFWHEITEGTEGLIMFSQRASDLWVERGGIIKPHDLRMFSESDAFFIPGCRSKPGSIPSFKNEGIGMSDYTGSEFIHMKPGSIDIETGTLNINADVNTTGELNNNGKNVGDTHTHGGSPTAPSGPQTPTGEVQ